MYKLQRKITDSDTCNLFRSALHFCFIPDCIMEVDDYRTIYRYIPETNYIMYVHIKEGICFKIYEYKLEVEDGRI